MHRVHGGADARTADASTRSSVAAFRLHPGMVRRVQPTRRAGPEQLDIRERLRPKPGAAVVSAAERARWKRLAGDRSAPRATPEPRVRRRRDGLAPQPSVCRVHVREPDDPRPSLVAVRILRDARAHRHQRRPVARLVDAGDDRALAAQRRDRHHGVLPVNAPRQRRVGRPIGPADLGRRYESRSPRSGIQTGPGSFTCGACSGTSARSGCPSTTSG